MQVRGNSCSESPCVFVSSHVQRDASRGRTVNKKWKYLKRWGTDFYEVTRSPSLFVNRRGRSSPRTLPTAPNRYVVKSEFVPPQIKHGLIETQNSFPSDTGRRRRELSQTIVDKDSLPLIDTCQHMP